MEKHSPPGGAALQARYAATLAHAHADRRPPAWQRAVLLLFLALLVYHALVGRQQLAELRHSLAKLLHLEEDEE